MKREDFARMDYYGERRKLARERARSGRDLIRISKLTRKKLDALREEFRWLGGYDELLYLLADAAQRDFELEKVNPVDPPGIHASRGRGKPAPTSAKVNRE